MTEFKFACPVCGQHMAADASSSGTQVECPTCFQKVIVPAAPHADSKYILSATQYIHPRGAENPTASSAEARPRHRAIRWLPVIVVVAGLAIAAVIFWREEVFPTQTSSETGDSLEPIRGNRTWSLDLSRTEFPRDTAAGRVRGVEFVCDRSVLQGRTLTLRQDHAVNPDANITISIALRTSGDLRGKSIEVSTNTAIAPRVTLRWRNSHQVTETFVKGYAMKLTFGNPIATNMPGRIYLCLPDEERSCVAGTFNAEIRRSANPRPRNP